MSSSLHQAASNRGRYITEVDGEQPPDLFVLSRGLGMAKVYAHSGILP